MKSRIKRGNTNSNMKMCLITPYLKVEEKLPKGQWEATQNEEARRYAGKYAYQMIFFKYQSLIF